MFHAWDPVLGPYAARCHDTVPTVVPSATTTRRCTVPTVSPSGSRSPQSHQGSSPSSGRSSPSSRARRPTSTPAGVRPEAT